MHALCLHLGYPHPDYLLKDLSAKQFLDWLAYYRQAGYGPARDDLHWGMMMSMFYNVNRSESSPIKTAANFMPYMSQDDSEEDVEGLDADKTAALADRIQGIISLYRTK